MSQSINIIYVNPATFVWAAADSVEGTFATGTTTDAATACGSGANAIQAFLTSQAQALLALSSAVVFNNTAIVTSTLSSIVTSTGVI